eukprot:g3995.t1
MDEGKERFMASQRLDGIDPNDEAALHRKRRANVALLIGHVREVLAPKLKLAGPTLLDVGSGNGEVAAHVGQEIQASTIKAYDVVPPEQNIQSIAAVHAGSDTYLEINLFDGKTLPEPNGSFDIVSAFFVLHHAGTVQVQLLREMVRVSRRFVLITEDTNEAAFVARNELHDRDGVFRTSSEWTRLFEDELGLAVRAEGRCHPKAVPEQCQYYYLLDKLRDEPLSGATAVDNSPDSVASSD